MKIAIIGSRGYPSNYGGYESFIKELSERLKEKYDVEVTVYCHKALFKWRPKELDGIRLVYLPAVETKSLSQITHSFLCILHACFSRFDILFVVNAANGPFGLISRIFGKKTVINVDGMEWLRPKWKGVGAKYFYWAAKMSTRFYDRIVTDAEEMRQVYLEEFNCDSQVIAYGAPEPRITGSAQKIALRGLRPREYYLIVGRLIPDNNSRLIAEGFLRSRSEKALVIVGGVPYQDPYVDSINELARTDSRLIVTGHINDRDEIAELFENTYMYIHGHEYGGTNPTMIEALGYGCAILALNTRFNQEMLQRGAFGEFFEKDVKSIQAAIDLWDREHEYLNAMRLKAQHGVTDSYKWDHVTNQYLKLFSSMTKSRDVSQIGN